MLAYWDKRYQDIYGSRANVSIYADDVKLKKIAGHIGLEKAQELIDFYFDNYHAHTINYFVYNYDKIAEHFRHDAFDREKINAVRKETAQRIYNAIKGNNEE